MHTTSTHTKTTAVTALCIALFANQAWGISAPAPAAGATPAAATAQRTADTKAAQARYDSDKKLCNDETSSAARLQCRRDAKAEYDHALAAAKAKASPAPAPATGATAAPAVATNAPSPAASAPEPACAECGRVMAVSVTQKAGDYSAAGVLAGGAIGAVLGNQVGGGLGKDLATIAGAVGGAYAGRVIEEKMKTHTVWNVTVHYANDSKTNFEFTADPGFQVGDRVKNSGNTVVRQ
ncbi:MAG TPA: glycine zipper 2TM domain-containing protein [Rhodoferax sp.]|jgi:outer membrane lipoprotein SlyB|nr:glycine zipper 2TM domain-containing protein [Rhodoferax sp.]HNV59713.1 glycine zipper 2TM domain-containing protein [Rhodoferax sp.]